MDLHSISKVETFENKISSKYTGTKVFAVQFVAQDKGIKVSHFSDSHGFYLRMRSKIL